MIIIWNDDRAFLGPVIDLETEYKKWQETQIGCQPQWHEPKPENWTGPWPKNNNVETQIHYAKRGEWFKKANALPIEQFLALHGFVEHPVRHL